MIGLETGMDIDQLMQLLWIFAELEEPIVRVVRKYKALWITIHIELILRTDTDIYHCISSIIDDWLYIFELILYCYQ